MQGFVVFVFLFIVNFSFAARKLPTYITPCKRYAPNISQCWESALLKIRPHLKDGIPELDIPPASDLRVNQLHLDQGNTANVNFIADLYNLTISNVDNFDVIYTNADFKTLVLEEGLVFPKLVMGGQYKAKGKVLIFEFEGEGEARGEFDNVKINGTWRFKIIQKKGKDHIQIDTSDLQVYIEKLSVNFDNLFRGNPEITRNVNNAINENTDILYNDFKPLLQKTLSSILNQYFNRVYILFPFDVLLPIN